MTEEQNPDAAVGDRETIRALAEVVGFRLRRLQTLFQGHWQRAIEDEAVSVSQVQAGVLLLIRDNPGISQIALAGLLKIEAPTLLQSLRPLIKKGLVSRQRAANDNRAFALSLSPLGMRVSVWISEWTLAQEDDFLAKLSARERMQLLGLLEKAIASGEAAFASGRLAKRPRSPFDDPKEARAAAKAQN